MKPILLGTLVGLISGTIFVFSWGLAVEWLMQGSRGMPSLRDVLNSIHHWFPTLLEGAGWGAMIGTVGKGFHEMTKALRTLQALTRQQTLLETENSQRAP